MMNTKEALEKSHIKDTANKNTLNLLVDYANGVTGNSDTNIGDAIKTLCDGFGQGGDEHKSEDIFVSGIDFPDVYINDRITTARPWMFSNLRNVIKIILPNLTGMIQDSLFRICSKLTYVDTGNANTIYTNVFSQSPNINTWVIRYNGIFTLSAISRAPSTLQTGTCYVYVPDELVESYKTANIWSTVADQIKPLSELEN